MGERKTNRAENQMNGEWGASFRSYSRQIFEAVSNCHSPEIEFSSPKKQTEVSKGLPFKHPPL